MALTGANEHRVRHTATIVAAGPYQGRLISGQ